MSHKLKALGLALFAVLALSAVSASGASAAGELFHAETAHSTLDFTQDGNGTTTGLQVFETTIEGALECTGVSGSATLTASTVTQVTATPVYSGCKKGSLNTDVKMRSCDYLFTSEITPTHAQVHIQCATPGDHIQVNGTILGSEVACVKIPAQTPTGGGVTYHNIGSGTTREVTITATVTGIEYTEVGACGSNTVANDGKYTGNVLVTGTNTAGEHEGVWWE